MQLDRRHALAALAVLPIAACAGGIGIPANVDKALAAAQGIINSFAAGVDMVEALGVVGPETIAEGRKIIAQAQAYLDKAKAPGSELWRTLADAILGHLERHLLHDLPAAIGGRQQAAARVHDDGQGGGVKHGA